jgi:hypothetical protein
MQKLALRHHCLTLKIPYMTHRAIIAITAHIDVRRCNTSAHTRMNEHPRVRKDAYLMQALLKYGAVYII